jgi:ribosomal protein S18 acetylase RimI-like enzyme
MTVIEGLTVRPPTLADAEGVATLMNVCSLEIEGRPETTPEEVLRFWQMPGVDLERDHWLVTTSDGKVAAQGAISDQSETHTMFFERGRVHPDYRGRGIGSQLLALAEARAREMVALVPPNARVTLRSGASSRNEAGEKFLRDHGFELIRYFWEMEIDLQSEPPEPHWPAGITVRPYIEGKEERAVFDALMDSFKDHWGFLPLPYDQWYAYITTGDRDQGLNFIALDSDEIAAICLCRPFLAEDPALGWVDDLGVRRAWRRRGLALALLHHSFREFYKRGTKRAGLGVDGSSLTGATGLYEKAGMHKTRQFNSYAKVLRDGEELMTQSLED